jgi:hypothetical protein
MSITLSSLLKNVPRDTFNRVDRTRKRIGATIREALRQETGLLLNRRDASPPDTKHETFAVPVSVVAGLPEILSDFVFDDDLALLLQVSPRFREFQQAKEGLAGIKPTLAILASQEAGQRLLKGREQAAATTLELVSEMVQLVEQADPIKKIMGVNQDVLGAYRYRVPMEGYEDETTDGQVDLYWGVIGLVSGMLGVSVEALAAVTLIHEVAHAYTHLGADIDGGRWGSRAFAASEPVLAEGLAQYYTHLVSQRVDFQVPDTHKTYRALLERQPEAYRAHLPWLEDFKPEEVRLALIWERRTGTGRVEQFESALRGARKGLRTGMRKA